MRVQLVTLCQAGSTLFQTSILHCSRCINIQLVLNSTAICRY